VVKISKLIYQRYNFQPSGHLESDGNYRIKFYSNDNVNKEGIIWIAKYIFIKSNSQDGIFIKENKSVMSYIQE